MLANGAKPAVQVNAQQLATAQKLLLFWRKPAVSSSAVIVAIAVVLIQERDYQRKCWWDATELMVDEGTPRAKEIKVWARRVWTLELSLVSLSSSPPLRTQTDSLQRQI